MYISEFNPAPGSSLSDADITALACFGFTVSSETIYAGYLVDRVLLRLAEVFPNSPKHWSRAEILIWLNDAVTELNLIAGYLTKTITISWSQTDNNHSLPNDTIIPIEIYYNNEVIRKYTIEGLDSKLVWDDGSVGYKPKAWCPFGTQNIIIWPLASSSGQNLSIVTLYQPSEITSESGEAIEVVSQYIDAIEHYMFARARFKEGGAEFQQADIDYARFFEQAVELKTRASQQRRVLWKTRMGAKSSYIPLKSQDEAQ